jgi:hypothetical protein
MDGMELIGILKALREHGVQHFKAGDMEVTLFPSGNSQMLPRSLPTPPADASPLFSGVVMPQNIWEDPDLYPEGVDPAGK